MTEENSDIQSVVNSGDQPVSDMGGDPASPRPEGYPEAAVSTATATEPVSAEGQGVAPPASAEQVAEGGDTPPSDAKDEGFFQREYQKVTRMLEQNDPALAQRIKQDMRYQRGKGDVPPPPTDSPSSDYEDDSYTDMTKAELARTVQDNTRQVIREEREADALVSESQNVKLTCFNYAETLGLTNAESKQAVDEANTYNINTQIPGNPTQWGKVVRDKLYMIAQTKRSSGRISEAERAEQERVRTASQTTGPGKTPAGEPAKRTHEQKTLDDMHRVGRSRVDGLFDSAHGG